MADIINLNKARKARARAEAAEKAVENCIRFGRTKAEKQQAKAEEALAARRLEALRLDRPDET